MFTRKPRLQLEKFAINGAKRLLQHNLPAADMPPHWIWAAMCHIFGTHMPVEAVHRSRAGIHHQNYSARPRLPVE